MIRVPFKWKSRHEGELIANAWVVAGRTLCSLPSRRYWGFYLAVPKVLFCSMRVRKKTRDVIMSVALWHCARDWQLVVPYAPRRKVV